MSEREQARFEKQVIRMPDGRQLIYYWFEQAPAAPEPAQRPPEAKKPAGEGR